MISTLLGRLLDLWYMFDADELMFHVRCRRTMNKIPSIFVGTQLIHGARRRGHETWLIGLLGAKGSTEEF